VTVTAAGPSSQVTLFIVDDDPAVCRALSTLARSAGLATRVYTSSELFLSEAARSADGCVVLDVKMPGIDGPTVLSRLREAGNQVPVIFITAHYDQLLGDRLVLAGARACFAKPVDPLTLIAEIRAALGDPVRRESHERPLPSC